MLELLIPLKETFNQSTYRDMEKWLAALPNDAAWYVISDYCFGNKSKQNDTVSFSVLLNHDKLANIKEYINAFAPKDIKSSRSIAPGFMQYINSPVIFNVTFVIDRGTKLLKEYADVENMKEFLPVFGEFVRSVELNASFEKGFVESVFRRIKMFEQDFKNKNFNANLSRKIYLVATFASLIFYYLTTLKQPSHIQWVSDRDALIDRYDGFIYDLAYFMFLHEYQVAATLKNNAAIIRLDKPKFLFALPDKTGINHYDELVRIPDYLAGTMADFNIEQNQFTKSKYYQVLHYSLVNSENHAVIHIYGNSKKLSSRRLVHKA